MSPTFFPTWRFSATNSATTGNTQSREFIIKSRTDKQNVIGLDRFRQDLPAGIVLGEASRAQQTALWFIDEPAQTRLQPLHRHWMIIGRDASCHIVVSNDSVSRQHALIHRQDDVWLVRDMQSTNGTLINGERIVHQEVVPGDIVQFGAALAVLVAVNPELLKRSTDERR